MRRRQGLLLFKALHRDLWHYDESEKTPADIKEFHSVCGTEFAYWYSQWQYVEEGEEHLPGNMCARCYRYLTGKSMSANPVRLISGTIESRRSEESS